MKDQNMLRVGIMSLLEAKRLQEEGVPVVLNHDEQSCTRGCAVTVEVLCLESDAVEVSKYLNKQNHKLFEGLDLSQTKLDAVVDFDSGEGTCPACGTIFNTSSAECPECGLYFR